MPDKLKKFYYNFERNNSFIHTSINQKMKMIVNVGKYLVTVWKRPLKLTYKPLVAQIESTSECNLDCEMCIRKKVGIPIGNMSFKNFKKVLRVLDTLLKIHISGQGEPFINPELFDMIDYANKKGIAVFFPTNGTLLTPSIIEKICKVDISEISISIDSTKKEKFEKIRKNADFDKVKLNIKNLVKELKRNDKKTVVGIGSILFKDNVEELKDFIEFAEDVGVKKLGFQTLQTKENYIENYGEDMKDQRVSELNSLNEKIFEAKKFAKEKDIMLIFDEEKNEGCLWPWRSIYITWEGYVTPCCKILDYRRPFFGNILKDNFWDIWNGPLYKRFRELLRDRKAPFGCEGCRMV